LENLITTRRRKRRKTTTTKITYVVIGDPFPGPKNEKGESENKDACGK